MKEINEHSHSAAGPVNGLMTLHIFQKHGLHLFLNRHLSDHTGNLHQPGQLRSSKAAVSDHNGEELADSIRANGIFQNLTVIPVDDNFEQFTVVIGHRRLAAAKLEYRCCRYGCICCCSVRLKEFPLHQGLPTIP